MSPKRITLDQALRALAEQAAQGPLTERGEFVHDAVSAQAVDALAAELGGRGARSKAIRTLLQKGAVQLLAERSTRA